MHVSTPFGDIAYRERGSGPAALFVHGVFLNGHLWRHVTDARRRRPPLYRRGSAGPRRYADGRGPGRLVPGPGRHARRASATALGLDQVDLVANDSGTAIAQLFAAHHPGRIRSLTLTNGDVHDNFPPPAVEPMLAAARGGLLPEIGRRMVADVEEARTQFAVGYEHPERVSADALRTYVEPLFAYAGAREEPRALHPRDRLPRQRRGRAAAASPDGADADRLGHRRRLLRHRVGALAREDDPRHAPGDGAAGRQALLPGGARRRAGGGAARALGRGRHAQVRARQHDIRNGRRTRPLIDQAPAAVADDPSHQMIHARGVRRRDVSPPPRRDLPIESLARRQAAQLQLDRCRGTCRASRRSRVRSCRHLLPLLERHLDRGEGGAGRRRQRRREVHVVVLRSRWPCRRAPSSAFTSACPFAASIGSFGVRRRLPHQVAGRAAGGADRQVRRRPGRGTRSPGTCTCRRRCGRRRTPDRRRCRPGSGSGSPCLSRKGVLVGFATCHSPRQSVATLPPPGTSGSWKPPGERVGVHARRSVEKLVTPRRAGGVQRGVHGRRERRVAGADARAVGAAARRSRSRRRRRPCRCRC